MAGSIRVICPNLKCRAILSAPDHARGRMVRCRMCGMKVKIPATAKVKAEPTPQTQVEGDDK
ncbi:MAG: hypothetical protein ACF8OB_19285 [Phycisphaeraceae bacterium JB051]